MEWLEYSLSEELETRQRENLLRKRQVVCHLDSVHVEIGGKRLVNFCSNNYLGLTHHPDVIRAASQAIDRQGVGSAASGLISGYSELHAQAERALAELKQSQSAVMLPSGYQANHAAIQTLAALGNVRFLLDKLAHASLIDAVRGVTQEFRVFPHNNMEKLGRLLEEAPRDQRQVVVTESVFSMDGDFADLRSLTKLKEEFGFALLLDEAHGTGCFGEAGAGYANEVGNAQLPDVTIVTLSKALGGVGGAVCGSAAFCQSLVNNGRAYIYSTEVPASVAGAAMAAIKVMREEPERQRRVRELSRRVRSALKMEGDSPIVPLILREEKAALSAAAGILEKGFLVSAIRPPTVPRGTSRLRITLSCEHADEEVDSLIQAIRSVG